MAPISRCLAFAIGLLVAAGISEARNTTGGTYLGQPLSVRQMGMGDVSLGADDVLRAWNNPVMFTLEDAKGQITLGGGSMFGEMSIFDLGGAMQLSRVFSIGAMLSSYAMDFDEIDALGSETGGGVTRSFLAGGLGCGFRASWFRGGILIKGYRDAVDDDIATGGAFDFGIGLSPIKGLLWSVAVRNLGPQMRGDEFAVFTTQTEDEALPRELRNGIAYMSSAIGLGGGIEFVSVKGADDRFGVGIEYWPVKYAAARFGVARLNLPQERQFTLGFSAQVIGIGFDYAFASHPLGGTHRVGLSYRFRSGKGDDAVAMRSARREREPEPAPAVDEPAPAPMTDEPGAPAAAGGKRLNMAVADLEAQNVSAGDAAVIADMLRNALIQTKRYNIVEKKNMSKVLEEQAFQQTGCTSEECAVKLGKLLNVQRIVVGSFGKLMDKYFVTVRVINVENGKIVFGESAKGRTVEDIERGVRTLAAKIRRQVR